MVSGICPLCQLRFGHLSSPGVLENTVATQAQVDELLAKMAEERAKLVQTVRSLSAEALRWAPLDAQGEAEWTPLEQLAHLAEMERTYNAWVNAALVSDNPDLAAIPWQRVEIPVEDALAATLEDLLAQLERERARTLALINSMTLDAFDRTATSPIFGTLTVLQWLRSFYRHDRQHIAQILGLPSEYKPNFIGGREPDQRRRRSTGPQAPS